jgi:hypothetical protein
LLTLKLSGGWGRRTTSSRPAWATRAGSWELVPHTPVTLATQEAEIRRIEV